MAASYPEPNGKYELEGRLFGICPYKAGSSMLFDYMSDICNELDLKWVNYPSSLWGAGASLNETCYEPKGADSLYAKNIVYLGNRESIRTLENESLSQSHAFIMLRDPRDCLVSMYFSFLGSHPAPASFTPEQIRQWNAYKQSMLDQTSIDEYVLSKAQSYKSNLGDIMAFARKAQSRHIIRYEDFILRKKDLCLEILRVYNLFMSKVSSIVDERLTIIAKAHDDIPSCERPNHHIRRALPGDHKLKLNSSTVRKLDSIFGDFMMDYNYI